jgi:hypothetical protein
MLKQNSITEKNKKEAVSYYSSWKTDGKPVMVQEVKKNDMENSLKMTLVSESENIYTGYVPKAFLKNISVQSPVVIHIKDKKIPCRILEIGLIMQLDTGMYPVKIFCPKKLSEKNNKYLAEVFVSSLKSVVILPHGSINMENNNSFVWMIKDGKAHKQFITLEERNNKGVVAKGIEEKNLIIIQGSAAIKESDAVKLNYGN